MPQATLNVLHTRKPETKTRIDHHASLQQVEAFL